MSAIFFQCLVLLMLYSEIKKNEGALNIMEANKYNESMHLSLKCKLGNDEQVKEYLSDKLLKS